MRKIIILLIAGLLFTACNNNAVPEEMPITEEPVITTTTSVAIPVTTTTTPPITTTALITTTPPPEPALPFISLDETVNAIIFVQSFNSMSAFDAVPVFENINEIPTEFIVKMFDKGFYIETADFEYTEEQLKELNLYNENLRNLKAYGIFPSTVEHYIKEKYNPFFNVGHYDFSVINVHQDWGFPFGLFLSIGQMAAWDEESGALIYLRYDSAGGGVGSQSVALKVKQEDDMFYVITVDFFSAHGNIFYVQGYYLHTIQSKNNDGFIMLSKQEIDIKDITFTEEEIENAKDFWASELILIENKFVMTAAQADKITQEIVSELALGTEVYWHRPNLYQGFYDGYYVVHIMHEDSRIGIVTINAITSEWHYEAYN
jgi:hypothetical protein